jgi:GINS complex subunit 3
MVMPNYPPSLQPRVIKALQADPKSVDLRAQAPHYYALGAKILDLFEDDDLVGVLLDVRIMLVSSVMY